MKNASYPQEQIVTTHPPRKNEFVTNVDWKNIIAKKAKIKCGAERLVTPPAPPEYSF